MPERKDVRRLTPEELGVELRTVREELVDLRFQLATRQLKNVRSIREVRRRMAQVMTALRAQENESA